MPLQKAKKRLQDNPQYQKEFMAAAIEFGKTMNTLIAKPDAKAKEYIDTMNKLKEHYQENSAIPKQFKTTFDDLFYYMKENYPDHKKDFEHLSMDYFIPVIAKYDTEAKKYLDEVNAVKMEYMPLEG